MDGDFYIFENNRYRQGFLYKNMIMSAILSEGVKPTLSELEKFEASIDDAEVECKCLKWCHFLFKLMSILVNWETHFFPSGLVTNFKKF